jgi:hypothetical protein
MKLLKKAISFPCFRSTGLSGTVDAVEEVTLRRCSLLTEGTTGSPAGILSPITCISLMHKVGLVGLTISSSINSGKIRIN